MFYTYVASISSGCRYICFAMATRVFFMVFQAYVASVSTILDVHCKVSARCCRSRSSVQPAAVRPICRRRLLQLLSPVYARGREDARATGARNGAGIDGDAAPHGCT
jgi:hypothetical protein